MLCLYLFKPWWIIYSGLLGLWVCLQLWPTKRHPVHRYLCIQSWLTDNNYDNQLRINHLGIGISMETCSRDGRGNNNIWWSLVLELKKRLISGRVNATHNRTTINHHDTLYWASISPYTMPLRHTRHIRVVGFHNRTCNIVINFTERKLAQKDSLSQEMIIGHCREYLLGVYLIMWLYFDGSWYLSLFPSITGHIYTDSLLTSSW